MTRAHSNEGAWDVVGSGHLKWRVWRPSEPGPEETLVKVAFAGICGSDLAKLDHRSRVSGPERPWRPGHEITGWDLGRSPARPVAVDPLIPCGRCAHCSTGEIHLCPALLRLGWDLPGAFAHHLMVPRSAVTALPEEADLAYGLLADPLAVAIHGLRCALPTTTGGRLAIIGSGAVAICTAAYAVRQGRRVDLIVRDVSKAAILQDELGIRVGTAETFRRSHFDVVVDAAAGRDAEPLNTALALARDGGHVVVQNAYAPGVRLDRDLRDLFRRSITLTGSFSFCRREGHDDFAEALSLLSERPAWAEPLTRARFPFQELPAVLDLMRGASLHRPLKAVLTP